MRAEGKTHIWSLTRICGASRMSGEIILQAAVLRQVLSRKGKENASPLSHLLMSTYYVLLSAGNPSDSKGTSLLGKRHFLSCLILKIMLRSRYDYQYAVL